MTLRQIIEKMYEGDMLSIHNEVGYVVFNSIVADLQKPVTKKIVSMYLDYPVARIRAFEGAVIVALGFKEA